MDLVVFIDHQSSLPLKAWSRAVGIIVFKEWSGMQVMEIWTLLIPLSGVTFPGYSPRVVVSDLCHPSAQSFPVFLIHLETLSWRSFRTQYSKWVNMSSHMGCQMTSKSSDNWNGALCFPSFGILCMIQTNLPKLFFPLSFRPFFQEKWDWELSQTCS